MSDHPLLIPIEDLLLALQTLTEHEKALLDDNKAQSKANDEHIRQITALIKKLTELLTTYQDKEQLIIDNTKQALTTAIYTAFQKNQENYHILINQGFTTHIDNATKTLATAATEVKQDLIELKATAEDSKTEFKRRQEFFKLYEDTYDTQSRNLTQSVNDTMALVVSDTKAKLDEVGQDFSNQLAKYLSWKVTLVLGGICLLIVLLTFGLAWWFIPSKDAIANRQASYQSLEKARVVHNVVKGQDGYYARVNPKNCVKDEKSSFYSPSVLCKFK